MDASTKVIPTKTVAFYPYTRGFGYAVMNSALDLVEYNLYDMKRFDTSRILSLMREIISTHKPVTVVLENTNSSYCRKGANAKQVIRSIALWTKKKNIPVIFYSRDDIREVFCRWHAKSKYEIAEVLKRNIESLQTVIFEKPKYPGREPNKEAIFSAVSLAVSHYFYTD